VSLLHATCLNQDRCPQAPNMKSFKEHIKGLKQSDWDYYFELDHKKLNNPFTQKNFHVNFVKRYFKRSGKSKILDFINILPNRKLDYNRTKHTNSIFFLGVLLYKQTNLQHEYFDDINTAEYKRFPFLWFLSCLFHDFGFTIEKDKKAIEGISNLNDLITLHKIDNYLLNEEPIFMNKTLFGSIENYFNFRLKEHKKIDHGIFAGIYFYDRLTKIRIIKSQEFDDTLFWGEELNEQYAQAANAIATHNIWLAEPENIENYKAYNLDALTTNFEPVSFDNFPLLYILGIVDTIDPIKAFNDYKFPPDYILRNILFEFNGNEFRIKNHENSKLDFNEILKKVKNLDRWLAVDIITYDNEVKLTLR